MLNELAQLPQDDILPLVYTYFTARDCASFSMVCKKFSMLKNLSLSEFVATTLVSHDTSWYKRFSASVQLLPNVLTTYLYSDQQNLFTTVLLDHPEHISHFITPLFRVTALAKLRLQPQEFQQFGTTIQQKLSQHIQSFRPLSSFDMSEMANALCDINEEADEKTTTTVTTKQMTMAEMKQQAILKEYNTFIQYLQEKSIPQEDGLAKYLNQIREGKCEDFYNIPPSKYAQFASDYKQADKIVCSFPEIKECTFKYTPYTADFSVVRQLYSFWPYYSGEVGPHLSAIFENMPLNCQSLQGWISQQGFLIAFAPAQFQLNQAIVIAALSHNPIWYLLLDKKMQDSPTTRLYMQQACGLENKTINLQQFLCCNPKYALTGYKQFPPICHKLSPDVINTPAFRILKMSMNPHLPFRNACYGDFMYTKDAAVTLANQVDHWPHSSQLRKTVCDLAYTFQEEDTEFLKKLAQVTPGIFKNAPPHHSIFQDKEYLLTLATTTPYIILNLPLQLQQNEDFLKRLLKSNIRAIDSFQYLPKEVQNSTMFKRLKTSVEYIEAELIFKGAM
jgi:hypothetical protein